MQKELEFKLNSKQIIVLVVSLSITYPFLLYLFGVADDLKGVVIQTVIYVISMTLFFIYLFPWIMKKMVSKRIKKIVPDLLEGEVVQKEILANLFRGIEGVGGKIFLTSNRLIFKSHSLNIQKGQINIEYSNIKSVEKRKTAKLLDNGIRVIDINDTKYDFVVNDRDIKLEFIKAKMRI